jgi:hypothetical protein
MLSRDADKIMMIDSLGKYRIGFWSRAYVKIYIRPTYSSIHSYFRGMRVPTTYGTRSGDGVRPTSSTTIPLSGCAVPHGH